MTDARACLSGGGVLVGHGAHAWAVRQWARGNGWRTLGRLLSGARQPGTPGGCRQLLAAGGFTDVNCFYVQPSLAAPMGLVPCHWRAARAHFLRAVWSAQGHHGRLAFALRWLSAYAGLGGLQQAELFYWARKPC